MSCFRPADPIASVQSVARRISRAVLVLLFAAPLHISFRPPLAGVAEEANGSGSSEQPETELPPWKGAQQETPARLLSAPSSPRESLINLEDSELDALTDHQPFDPEHPTLSKILFRLPRFGLDNIERYAAQTRDIPWQELLDDPKSHRVQMFHLTGRVKLVAVQKLQPEVAQFMEFSQYYRVTFVLQDATIPVEIATLTIPQAWAVGRPIDERASCYGLFLNVGEPDGEYAAPLHFATHRMAWHPDREDALRDIGPGHILLGNAGLDVGLFDDVRPLNGRGLGPGDGECFYQLLAAVGRTDSQELTRRATAEFPLAPLLQQPQRQHGKLLTVEGTARRITKILIDRPYFRKRLGLDHYYEIDMLIPLGDQTIRLTRGKDDEPAPEYTIGFPLTVCCLELPDDLRESEKLNETIRIPAFYFKLWTYKTEYMRRFGEDRSQLSPLLIGRQPELVHVAPLASPLVSQIGLGIILVALFGMWIGLRIYSRGNRKFERETLRRKFSLKQGESLDDLGIKAQDGPDFSKLD